MSLPNEITAGDTLEGSAAFSDYPANAGWTLTFRIINENFNYTFNATTNGTAYAISVPFATTSKWQAGKYSYVATVSNGTKRFTVEEGTISIKQNLIDVATGGFDNRTQARQILDALKAAYKKAVDERAFVFEYQIAGRMMRFNKKDEWIKELNFWEAAVAKEERAAKLANGSGGSAKVFVRM